MEERDERSLQQVYRSAVSGLYARLKNNYDFLHGKYGDDGIKLISEMSREYGLNIAARAKLRLKDNDLASVAQYLIRIFDTVGRGKEETVKPVVWEDSRVIITVGECPLHFTIPAMCLAHTTMERTVVETLNPGLTYRIGKSIPAGDAYCEHIIEMK
jgi:hypothetical protein